MNASQFLIVVALDVVPVRFSLAVPVQTSSTVTVDKSSSSQ